MRVFTACGLSRWSAIDGADFIDATQTITQQQQQLQLFGNRTKQR